MACPQSTAAPGRSSAFTCGWRRWLDRRAPLPGHRVAHRQAPPLAATIPAGASEAAWLAEWTCSSGSSTHASATMAVAYDRASLKRPAMTRQPQRPPAR